MAAVPVSILRGIFAGPPGRWDAENGACVFDGMTYDSRMTLPWSDAVVLSHGDAVSRVVVDVASSCMLVRPKGYRKPVWPEFLFGLYPTRPAVPDYSYAPPAGSGVQIDYLPWERSHEFSCGGGALHADRAVAEYRDLRNLKPSAFYGVRSTHELMRVPTANFCFTTGVAHVRAADSSVWQTFPFKVDVEAASDPVGYFERALARARRFGDRDGRAEIATAAKAARTLRS